MLPALILVAATSAQPKPLRHMEFSFHFADVSYHYTEGGPASGGGYDGTIFVDVLGLGPNDTLLISMRQEVPKAHSVDVPPAQVVTYPTGQVDVPANSIPLSEPELNLARFLGRKFINGDYLDAKNHWHIDMTLPGNASAATDFTINKNTNGILDIAEEQTVKAQMSTTSTKGHIVYDMNRTVPLNIREEKTSISGVDFTYDYSLTADSLAPAKP